MEVNKDIPNRKPRDRKWQQDNFTFQPGKDYKHIARATKELFILKHISVLKLGQKSSLKFLTLDFH